MSKERRIYLKMKTREEARKILLERFARLGPLPAEQVPTHEAVGRVLAEPVFARLSSPNYHAAAMDGIAVRAHDTFGANEANPVRLQVGEKAFFVNTGHLLPDDTDAVIMIEQVHIVDDRTVQIEAAAYPWQYVRKMGEDIVATELLFPQNHRVSPSCMGALLTAGIFSLPVKQKPRVLIIPTGSELVEWESAPPAALKPNQVLETNSYVLGELAGELGAAWSRRGVIPDDFERIGEAVLAGAKGPWEMVLVTAGSSAGSRDHTANVIQELGEILVHGVTIMPGKPVVLGAVEDKPVIGIPGYPVSAIVAFEEFVRPLLCRMLGQLEPERPGLEVEPSRKIPSRLGLEELIRVKLGMVGERVVATPLPRGAGSITTLTEADGILRIPNEVEGINPGQKVRAELLRPLSRVRNNIVVVGSHDNTLDVLADAIRRSDYRFSLASSHVGSMGGLMAVKRGVCHLAGSHLLDTEDGTYNLSYIRKYLAEIPVRLVQLVFRDQGLIVPRGNPKDIRGIEDLVREDVLFMNRQAGSGTRILLDYRLRALGIDPSRIRGYDREEYTHMAVAVAVLSGAADVGLGIMAAARALDLDFVPVVTEQYDLVIPQEHFETEKIRILIDTIRSEDFKARVLSLGGYHTERTGEILA